MSTRIGDLSAYMFEVVDSKPASISEVSQQRQPPPPPISRPLCPFFNPKLICYQTLTHRRSCLACVRLVKKVPLTIVQEAARVSPSPQTVSGDNSRRLGLYTPPRCSMMQCTETLTHRCFMLKAGNWDCGHFPRTAS